MVLKAGDVEEGASEECCGNFSPIVSEGEELCSGCGKVFGYEEATELGSSSIDMEKNTNSSHHAALDPSIGKTSTSIGRKKVDHSNRPLSSEMRNTMKRLSIWDSRTADISDKKMKSGVLKMSGPLAKMGFSDAMANEAKRLYKKTASAGMAKGRTVDGIAATVAYAIVKKYDLGKPVSEIADNFNIKRKTIFRSYKAFLKNDDIGPLLKSAAGEGPGSEIRKYLTRAVSELYPDGVKAHVVMSYANGVMGLPRIDDFYGGKNRKSITAALVYYGSKKADGLPRYRNGRFPTQKKIAEVSGVSEVTLRNRYNDLSNFIKESGSGLP